MESESKTVDITPNKDRGVLKEILKEGKGDEHPLSGDKVKVHYVGTLEDGSQFDSSRSREKFEFSLGKGEVIKAWDLGVATMKRGEVCKLICKSDYAYGAQGSPPKIPPNATLIFEVELFEWGGEDLSATKDGGIIRRIIQSGNGYTNPNNGAMVDVELIGRIGGSVFDQRRLKFSLGSGFEHNIPEGLERALERFKANEKSIIKLLPEYGFGPSGNSNLGVTPNSTVEYEIHLHEFERAKESWEMDDEEKVEQAKLCKERGTEYFKQQKYLIAIKEYKKVTGYLKSNSDLSPACKTEFQTLLLGGHLNLSLCYLKLKDYISTKDHATKALELDENNVKALFRRGQALFSMEDTEDALHDFAKCLTLEPDNKAAANHHQLCLIKIKLHKEKEKKLYAGMFDKFAKKDAQAATKRAKTDETKNGRASDEPTEHLTA